VTIAAMVIAGCVGPNPVSPTRSVDTTAPSPTLSVGVVPKTGDAAFYFEQGPVRWCGAFGAPASGQLKIGSAVFSGPSSPPFIGYDVQPGSWVCLSGTIVRSETSANQLSDVSVASAPIGSMPPGPINATPCGLITDVFVGDVPAGGYITVNGTKFIVGGIGPPSDVVQLTPSELRVGVSVCIVGTRLTSRDAGVFNANGGRVMVMR
jgi:hypothetical protein